MIRVLNRTGLRIPAAPLLAAARLAMRGDRLARRNLTIALLDGPDMAALNRRHLRHKGPTDVLAFAPGDIAVCPAVARREAVRRGLDWREELARYVIHGCLHLRGYTDKKPAEKRRMWRRQEALLAALLRDKSARPA